MWGGAGYSALRWFPPVCPASSFFFLFFSPHDAPYLLTAVSFFLAASLLQPL